MYKADLSAATVKTWQPYFTVPLEQNDIEEIISRWSGFMRIASDYLEATQNVLPELQE